MEELLKNDTRQANPATANHVKNNDRPSSGPSDFDEIREFHRRRLLNRIEDRPSIDTSEHWPSVSELPYIEALKKLDPYHSYYNLGAGFDIEPLFRFDHVADTYLFANLLIPLQRVKNWYDEQFLRKEVRNELRVEESFTGKIQLPDEGEDYSAELLGRYVDTNRFLDRDDIEGYDIEFSRAKVDGNFFGYKIYKPKVGRTITLYYFDAEGLYLYLQLFKRGEIAPRFFSTIQVIEPDYLIEGFLMAQEVQPEFWIRGFDDDIKFTHYAEFPLTSNGFKHYIHTAFELNQVYECGVSYPHQQVNHRAVKAFSMQTYKNKPVRILGDNHTLLHADINDHLNAIRAKGEYVLALRPFRQRGQNNGDIVVDRILPDYESQSKHGFFDMGEVVDDLLKQNIPPDKTLHIVPFFYESQGKLFIEKFKQLPNPKITYYKNPSDFLDIVERGSLGVEDILPNSLLSLVKNLNPQILEYISLSALKALNNEFLFYPSSSICGAPKNHIDYNRLNCYVYADYGLNENLIKYMFAGAREYRHDLVIRLGAPDNFKWEFAGKKEDYFRDQRLGYSFLVNYNPKIEYEFGFGYMDNKPYYPLENHFKLDLDLDITTRLFNDHNEAYQQAADIDKSRARHIYPNGPYMYLVLDRKGTSQTNEEIYDCILFICADAVSVYKSLFNRFNVRPKQIAFKYPGEGFGGNYTRYSDEEGVFFYQMRQNKMGLPETLFDWDYGRSEPITRKILCYNYKRYNGKFFEYSLASENKKIKTYKDLQPKELPANDEIVFSDLHIGTYSNNKDGGLKSKIANFAPALVHYWLRIENYFIYPMFKAEIILDPFDPHFHMWVPETSTTRAIIKKLGLPNFPQARIGRELKAISYIFENEELREAFNEFKIQKIYNHKLEKEVEIEIIKHDIGLIETHLRNHMENWQSDMGIYLNHLVEQAMLECSQSASDPISLYLKDFNRSK